MDDFKLKKVLGKGSFGKVMLVTLKSDPTQTLMAMKTLRKAALIKRNQLAHTATERHVLQHLDHPFLVKLMYAFQTQDKLYMVLESAAARDVRATRARTGRIATASKVGRRETSRRRRTPPARRAPRTGRDFAQSWTMRERPFDARRGNTLTGTWAAASSFIG